MGALNGVCEITAADVSHLQHAFALVRVIMYDRVLQSEHRACMYAARHRSELATSMTQQFRSHMFDNGHMVLRDTMLLPEAIEKVFLQTTLRNGTRPWQPRRSVQQTMTTAPGATYHICYFFLEL